MRGEQMKKAVQEISKHSYYSTTSIACEKALKSDTPESYALALNIAKSDGYLTNVLKAEEALKNEGL